MMITKRTSVVAVATGAALVAAGGLAYGFWSTSASGNGTALAGTASSIVASAPTITGALVPGGQADVKMTLTNNNKANVSLSALAFTNTGIAGYTDNTFATAKTGCSTTGVTWTALTKTLTPIVIAGNGGTYTLTLTNAASMDTTSDDLCQGATFKMPLASGTAQLVGTAASAPTAGTQ